MQPKYQLRIQVEMVPCDQHGYATGGNLRISEEVQVEAAGFLEIAGILGRFHDLSESLKEKRDAG